MIKTIKEYRDGMSLPIVKLHHPWLLYSVISGAVVGGTKAKLKWYDGVWFSGHWKAGSEWLGGYDRRGHYHAAGDSPDKWLRK